MVVQAPLRPVGFVVAGGLGTRMGRDKALLPWRGSTLLDHAIARLAAVCDDVRILCGPSPRYRDRGRALVVDVIPEGPLAARASSSAPAWRAGPLAGLAAGLADAGGAAGLYLAVDLPNVPIALLAALAAGGDTSADGATGREASHGDAGAGDADAVVPVTAQGAEPLCALYRPRCLPAVRARLAAGDLRMTSFWPDVRVRILDDAALAAFGDPRVLFHNVNAPGDYRDGAPDSGERA